MAGHQDEVAVQWVIERERAAGRAAVDVRGRKPYDVESGPRHIEVKSCNRTARGAELWLEPSQWNGALHDPAYYIYVVDNIGQGDPSLFVLRVLHGEPLRTLAARAREQHYYTVTLWAREYDVAPSDV